jgi:chemotaxis family two-component system response regulator Rcp1
MQNAIAERLILLIDDDLHHAHFIEDALRQSSQPHRIMAISDGTQAMDFLHRRNDYETASRPDLILLDLNLSGKDGREVLAEIKADPQLKRIPTIVLTLSDRSDDIFHTYLHQGNCYVIKSANLEQLGQIVKRIEEFWLGIVTLPVE